MLVFNTECQVVLIYVLYLLAQASHGSIVNISSVGGQRCAPGATAYCVSKAAVDMLTKASALELAPKVGHPPAQRGSNCVCRSSRRLASIMAET